MNRKLRSQLQTALENQPTPQISEVHLADTIQSARIAYQNGRRRERIGYMDFLHRQVRLAGLPVWLRQGGVLLLMLGFLGYVLDGDLTCIKGRHLPLLMGCLAVFMVMTGIPFLGRSAQYRMLEMEMATRMSLPGLLISRMLIIGAGNVLVLGMALLLANARTDFFTGSMLAYLLLPYLMACCAYMLIQTRIDGQRQVFMSISFCLLLIALLVMLYNVFPQVYEQAWLGIWEILCAVFAAVLAVILGIFLKRAASLDFAPAAEI